MKRKRLEIKKCISCKKEIDPELLPSGEKRRRPLIPCVYEKIKYCSHECSYADKRGRHEVLEETKKCLVCHRKISQFFDANGNVRKKPLSKYTIDHAIYCSHRCAYRAREVALHRKFCLFCKKQIPTTAPWKYLKMKYCSRDCVNKSQIKIYKKRFCKYCGELLVQRENERGPLFGKRVFCNRKCYALFQFHECETERQCEYCGKELARKHFTWRDGSVNTEPRYWYRHRRFCDMKCSNLFKIDKNNVEKEKKNRRLWWSRGNVNFVAKPFVKNRTVIPSKEIAVSINESSAIDRVGHCISAEISQTSLRELNVSSVEVMMSCGDVESE